MNIWGKKKKLEIEKFYKFLQKHLKEIDYHKSPSKSVVDDIKRYSRNKNISQSSFYSFINRKIIIPSLSIILIIFFITSNYSTKNKIYVYQEQLLNTNNQILFVTDDILSDDELTIQYAFMQML
jgi:hypothetical protein